MGTIDIKMKKKNPLFCVLFLYSSEHYNLCSEPNIFDQPNLYFCLHVETIFYDLYIGYHAQLKVRRQDVCVLVHQSWSHHSLLPVFPLHLSSLSDFPSPFCLVYSVLRIHTVAQTSFKLPVIPLSRPCKCWDSRPKIQYPSLLSN